MIDYHLLVLEVARLWSKASPIAKWLPHTLRALSAAYKRNRENSCPIKNTFSFKKKSNNH